MYLIDILKFYFDLQNNHFGCLNLDYFVIIYIYISQIFCCRLVQSWSNFSSTDLHLVSAAFIIFIIIFHVSASWSRSLDSATTTQVHEATTTPKLDSLSFVGFENETLLLKNDSTGSPKRNCNGKQLNLKLSDHRSFAVKVKDALFCTSFLLSQ